MGAQYYHARLSASELDLILRYDPDLRPTEDVGKKLAEMTRFVNSVQSIVDDAIEEW